jgi:hypothetical protein
VERAEWACDLGLSGVRGVAACDGWSRPPVENGKRDRGVCPAGSLTGQRSSLCDSNLEVSTVQGRL